MVVALIDGYFPRDNALDGSEVEGAHFKEESDGPPSEYKNLDGEGEPDFSENIDGFFNDERGVSSVAASSYSFESDFDVKPAAQITTPVKKISICIVYCVNCNHLTTLNSHIIMPFMFISSELWAREEGYGEKEDVARGKAQVSKEDSYEDNNNYCK